MCALEGASLFYPENDDEAHAVLSFWNATQPYRWVYVGISDLIVKGVFETIDGKHIFIITLCLLLYVDNKTLLYKQLTRHNLL